MMGLLDSSQCLVADLGEQDVARLLKPTTGVSQNG